ncbi:MAG: DUF1992 domain-containing protein [Deltaproteobacteria bacterium]|nr:DUF1992 domain-containing protein [Deltaproteobacteria bacterium]
MITGFEKIVEQRIEKALKEGKFEKLDGEGVPFSKDDLAFVPEDLRLAYRIFKTSGFLPPEIEVRKKIEQTEYLLANCKDTKKKYKIMKKINLLITKANLLRKNKKVNFDISEKYMDKIGSR